MPPKTDSQRTADLAAALTKYKLWSSLLDELNISFHGVLNTEYFFRCKHCQSYSIRFDVGRLNWNCICKPQKSYPRNSWLKLLMYLTTDTNKGNADSILNEAQEIISAHEKALADDKAATRLRNQQYGCYESKPKNAAKKSTKPVTPRKSKTVKPKRTAKTKNKSGVFQIWK
jgi:hypothetical protein